MIRAARALLAQRVRTGVVIQVADQVKDFLRADLGPLEHEQFSAFMLDAQHRLIAYRRLFRGALTETSVHAREVVKEALSCNAAAVILCHNLPSGRADASESDVALTRLLQAALELVDVKVIDHLIVGGHEVSSFAEDGLL